MDTTSVVGESWITDMLVKMSFSDSESDVKNGMSAFMEKFNKAILVAAEQVFVPELKRTLSVMGPPASDPFTPPHRQTDEAHAQPGSPNTFPHLQDSIRAWMSASDGVVVGADNNPYALFLEIGTQTMAPRPWLSVTLERADIQYAFARALIAELGKDGSQQDQSESAP